MKRTIFGQGLLGGGQYLPCALRQLHQRSSDSVAAVHFRGISPVRLSSAERGGMAPESLHFAPARS